MKAVRIHGYHQQPVVDEVPEPTIKGPFDVVVKIGGAGVCRTDLHIIEGQWDAAMHPALPYTLGHENAGWVHEVGSGVTNLAVGDTVILHPLITDGQVGDARAHLVHPARVLVAEGVRQGGIHGRFPLALDDVQVGAAYSRPADPHNDVERALDARLGHLIDDGLLVIPMYPDGLHCSPPRQGLESRTCAAACRGRFPRSPRC